MPTSSSDTPTPTALTSGKFPGPGERLSPKTPAATESPAWEAASRLSPERATKAQPPANWEVEVFYDGDCPLCRREINWLRKRDRNHKVRFTDIAAADFDPSVTGKSLTELMARIHGRLPSSQVIEGVEVFRRLYSAVGLGWLVAPTRLPGIRQSLDLAYRVFARYRLRLTGRCSAQSCGAIQQ